MENQTIVRGKYPNATARQYKANYQFGKATPNQAGQWTIYPSEALGVHTLATASTEAEAWTLAASKVLEGQPKAR